MQFNKIKLKDIADINMGQSPSGSSYKNNGRGIPFLQGNKTFGFLYPTIDTWTTEPKKIGKKNSVLMSVRAPVGDLNIANKDICIGRGLCSIEMKNGNNQYLYYLLKNSIKKIKMKSTGTVFDSINRKELENIEILDFDKSQQKKISKVLFDIDKKIELNIQTNDNLYEITNKLYEQLFFIERKDDWKEYNLQELMDISNGYSYTGKELVDTSVVGMATIKNFERTGGFKEEGFKDIEPIKAKDVHYVDKFDILVACTDLTQNADIIGNAIMLLNSSRYKKVVISMDLVKILPKKNKYLVFSILNSKEFKNFALGYKTGTTVLHLNKNCFKDFNIRLPDLDKVENFEKMVETNYKKISYNLEENDTLIQLRDTLLPKLMNGEIDLDKIEI